MAFKIDAHMDIPWLQTKYEGSNGGSFDYTAGHLSSIFSVEAAKEGGLDAAIFALYLSDSWQDAHSAGEIENELVRQIHRLYHSSTYVCASVSDFKMARVHYPNRFSVLLGLEGGRLINNSLARLRNLYDLGAFYLTLTHNRDTIWADSATGNQGIGGLASFGYNVVKECNKIGMLVDVSHASDDVVYDVLSTTTKPIAATHSGCRALVKQPRNLPDTLIKRIAETGGIVCVPYVKKFMGCYTPAQHIHHIVDLVGINHVGIGSDIDGAVLVNGFTNVNQWQSQVLGELVAYGYGPDDLDKIFGENLLRVLEAVVA